MPVNVPVVENILSANDRLAQENHARIDTAGVFSINLMASPGAGKTSLIEQTLPRLGRQVADRRCGWRYCHLAGC